jgi:hypothetical protein
MENDDYIRQISADVLTVLRSRQFFSQLDDLLAPARSSRAIKCKHDFQHSRNILRKLGFKDDDIADVIAVLQASGACCDCEVLYNVAEESRLKSKHWKKQGRELLL